MPFFDSKNILAKDIIGWAIELAAVEQARLTLKSVGRTFYNLAVSEIYTLLGYVDVESLTKNAAVTVSSPTGHYKSASINTASFKNYDKVLGLEFTNNTSTNLTYLQSFPLPLEEFLRHKSNTVSGVPEGAQHPYEESVVYTLTDDVLHVLWGKDITINTPICTMYFTRQQTLLTEANHSTAYMDVPDKYAALLANRIASYAELREGVSDKSLALVKGSYEQLLAPLDSQIRSKIMESFQFKQVFTPNE